MEIYTAELRCFAKHPTKWWTTWTSDTHIDHLKGIQIKAAQSITEQLLSTVIVAVLTRQEPSSCERYHVSVAQKGTLITSSSTLRRTPPSDACRNP